MSWAQIMVKWGITIFILFIWCAFFATIDLYPYKDEKIKRFIYNHRNLYAVVMGFIGGIVAQIVGILAVYLIW